jgi:F-box-like
MEDEESKPLPDRIPNLALRIIFQYVRDGSTKKKIYNNEGCVMDKKLTRKTKLADKRDDWLHRLSFMDMRDGRHSLLPLSLVCRRWNKIANELLYEEIQVSDGTYTRAGLWLIN